MAFKFNAFTGNFDVVRNAKDTATKVYFGTGAYFTFDESDTVSLYINDILVETWTAAPTAGASGSPQGLLLALTYP